MEQTKQQTVQLAGSPAAYLCIVCNLRPVTVIFRVFCTDHKAVEVYFFCEQCYDMVRKNPHSPKAAHHADFLLAEVKFV